MLVFRSEGHVIDFTPTADTAAGSVVNLGLLGYGPIFGVTTSFIKANTLGSVRTGGVFVADNDGAVAFNADDDAFWDTVLKQVVAAAGADTVFIGKIFKTNLATDAEVHVLINNRPLG